MKGGYGGDAYAQSPALDLQVDSIPIPEVWSVSPCVLGRKKNVLAAIKAARVRAEGPARLCCAVPRRVLSSCALEP